MKIRLLTEQDIPFGMRLKDIARWNQTPDDWKRFLALSPDGCFVAEWEGQQAGTATTTTYGDRFGWVGMVLVAPEMRRKGIGTRLLKHAITHLEEAGVASVRLDATPLGKELYDTLGFQDDYELERMEGVAQEAGGLGTAMKAGDVAEVAAFDAERFGADRSKMLATLCRQAPQLCFLSRSSAGALDGYIMARPGQNAYQIGPWIATHPDAAEGLFRRTLTALGGRRVFLDVPRVSDEPSHIVRQHGFTTQRPFIRMYRGELRHPGRPGETYGICGAETG